MRDQAILFFYVASHPKKLPMAGFFGKPIFTEAKYCFFHTAAELNYVIKTHLIIIKIIKIPVKTFDILPILLSGLYLSSRHFIKYEKTP